MGQGLRGLRLIRDLSATAVGDWRRANAAALGNRLAPASGRSRTIHRPPPRPLALRAFAKVSSRRG